MSINLHRQWCLYENREMRLTQPYPMIHDYRRLMYKDHSHIVNPFCNVVLSILSLRVSPFYCYLCTWLDGSTNWIAATITMNIAICKKKRYTHERQIFRACWNFNAVYETNPSDWFLAAVILFLHIQTYSTPTTLKSTAKAREKRENMGRKSGGSTKQQKEIKEKSSNFNVKIIEHEIVGMIGWVAINVRFSLTSIFLYSFFAVNAATFLRIYFIPDVNLCLERNRKWNLKFLFLSLSLGEKLISEEQMCAEELN